MIAAPAPYATVLYIIVASRVGAGPLQSETRRYMAIFWWVILGGPGMLPLQRYSAGVAYPGGLKIIDSSKRSNSEDIDPLFAGTSSYGSSDLCSEPCPRRFADLSIALFCPYRHLAEAVRVLALAPVVQLARSAFLESLRYNSRLSCSTTLFGHMPMILRRGIDLLYHA